ncbi:hypothetical protein HZA57_04455 [Candidatus Poribacteria bacterium]|nr:hypothetical protein [Candidatus Poribacteria bacterium]
MTPQSLPAYADGGLFRPGHPSDLAERFGGFLVAFAVSAVSFAWLSTSLITTFRVPEALPSIRIVLGPSEEPVPAALQELPAFADIVATYVQPEEPQGPPPEDAAEEDTKPGQVTVANWRPTTEKDAESVRAVLDEMALARQRLGVAETELKGRVNRLAVESAGREFLFNSDGGKSGIIRTLDFEGMPDEVVNEVCARYGIEVEYKFVRPDAGSRRFLNAALTSEGAFTSAQEEGYYHVFSLTPKAVSMMAAIEVTALMARGFEPGTTRIRKITFGIVKDNEGVYVLGVTDLEAEDLR